jgi:hypothetical protein
MKNKYRAIAAAVYKKGKQERIVTIVVSRTRTAAGDALGRRNI